MTSTPALPPKLQAVLIRLGLARRLNITQAVKLPYLVDVVAKHVLGEPITDATYEAWEMGVVASQVWHQLDKYQSPDFHLEPVPFSGEKRLVVDAEDEDQLTAEERAVVDFVVEEFADLRAVDLGRLTKLMNPDIRTWAGNRRVPVDNDSAYERLTTDYQEMAEAVAALSLESLERAYEVVEDIEDALA